MILLFTPATESVQIRGSFYLGNRDLCFDRSTAFNEKSCLSQRLESSLARKPAKELGPAAGR